MSDCCDTQGNEVVEGQSVIALAGNPNCGKTTIFNLLTGAHQHVGNWPGVTVERRAGSARIGGEQVSVVDLPGVYSLMGGGGIDQAVARNFLLNERVDLIVNIIDSSNLERHLALTAELLETGRPMVVVLNMADEAQSLGIRLQVEKLSTQLAIPVIPMVARKSRGKQDLFALLAEGLETRPHPRRITYQEPLEQALNTLAEALPSGKRSHRHFEALRLLSGMADPTTPAIRELVLDLSERILVKTGDEADVLFADIRFGWAHERAHECIQYSGTTGIRQRLTDTLDRIALHDWLGVPVFLGILYLVFVISFSGGNILLDFFDQASATLLINGVGHLLYSWGLPDSVVSLIAGGVGGGLNLVISFIPPIGMTFLMLAFLDDSGYMARAAYAMDRMMRRLGLPGNSLVPMVIGFGCNVPAVMGSRIIEDPRGRLLTIVMQPFMSCSARLTIYMAFAVVFFRENGGQIVFLLYLIGILMALFTAYLLGKTAVRGKPQPFVMELPPYRLPSLRSVVLQSWQRLKIFIFRVGRVIAVIGVVLFILPGIGWTDKGFQTTDINNSILAQGSRALTPIFEPMGVDKDNWPAVSGLIAGAAAKEIVIGTLNGVYQRQNAADLMEGYRDPDISGDLLAALKTIPDNAITFITTLGDPLGLNAMESNEGAESASGASGATLKAIAADFTPLSAFAYLVFVLLYMPCAATLGALRREIGWGWMIFTSAYGAGTGWSLATLIYQIGTFNAHPTTSLSWIGIIAFAFALLVGGLKWFGQYYDRRGSMQDALS